MLSIITTHTNITRGSASSFSSLDWAGWGASPKKKGMEIFLFPFITSLFTSTFIWQWRSIVYFCCWSFIGDQCCDCTRRIFQHALVWKPITHSCNFGFPYDLLWKGWQLKQHLKHGEFSSMMNVAAGRGWRLYGLCPLWIWTDKSEAKWKEACWKLSFSIRRLNFHNFLFVAS